MISEAVWLKAWMTTGCTTCGKWVSLGGGLCGVCRTLDRLCSLVRGPDFPEGAGTEVLLRLRSWTAELTDLSEALRGVAPNPKGGGTPQAAVRVTDLAPGAAGKAAGPRPPEELAKQYQVEKPSQPKEEADARSPKVKEESSPEEPSRKKKKRRRSSSSSRRRRKRSKRTRSPGRTPLPRRSPKGSPKVKSEAEEEHQSAPSSSARPSHKRELGPRPPSCSPPPDLGRRTGRPATSKPLGRDWQGPIPAHKREPAPRTGKHWGKYKGEKKERRNDAFFERKRQEAQWHQRG